MTKPSTRLTLRGEKLTPVKVSVVVPVFNEVGILKELYERLTKVMKQREPYYELVFVDDGSTDGSYDALKISRGR